MSSHPLVAGPGPPARLTPFRQDSPRGRLIALASKGQAQLEGATHACGWRDRVVQHPTSLPPRLASESSFRPVELLRAISSLRIRRSDRLLDSSECLASAASAPVELRNRLYPTTVLSQSARAHDRARRRSRRHRPRKQRHQSARWHNEQPPRARRPRRSIPSRRLKNNRHTWP